VTATLGDALALATIGHSGQKYGDQPYIVHPVAVAKLILKAFGPQPRLLIPALLHDVVEDCGVTLGELADLGYGYEDVDTIDQVTRRHDEVNYLDFVRRAARHERGLIVKLADNTHNLSGLPVGDYREGRYLKARRILLDALGGNDPWYGMCPTVDHVRVES
jgi:(p)ppGpp synthase/HD superfamily hydrolase